VTDKGGRSRYDEVVRAEAVNRADPTPLASLIAELKQAYHDAGLDCGDGLLPPAPKTELDRLAHELSLTLPAELVALYAVHGGQKSRAPVAGLFGSHELNTPAEVVSHHKGNCDNFLGYEGAVWRPRLIPFASWDVYDLCVDSRSGKVCEFTYTGGGSLRCHRPSIAAVLREMLEAVRAGEEPRLREYREPSE
jgi:hypothetical protein